MTDRPVLATGEFVETVYDLLPVLGRERRARGNRQGGEDQRLGCGKDRDKSGL
jgi:hypothetical protein